MDKIWKYLDLAKFISMLANDGLYFACPIDFHDPYEGYLPQTHVKAMLELSENFVTKEREIFKQAIAEQPTPSAVKLEKTFDEGMNTFLSKSKAALSTTARKFGVSCWHKSPHESEAMWNLYSSSGHCIAIESTRAQLRDSIIEKDGVYIEDVRYADFETDPIEKGHKHYALVMKRKSFEHEKELRAFKLLREEGKGQFLKCDLSILINAIHISPSSPPFLLDAVNSLCSGKIAKITKPTTRSKLLDKPSY